MPAHFSRARLYDTMFGTTIEWARGTERVAKKPERRGEKRREEEEETRKKNQKDEKEDSILLLRAAMMTAVVKSAVGSMDPAASTQPCSTRRRQPRCLSLKRLATGSHLRVQHANIRHARIELAVGLWAVGRGVARPGQEGATCLGRYMASIYPAKAGGDKLGATWIDWSRVAEQDLPKKASLSVPLLLSTAAETERAFALLWGLGWHRRETGVGPFGAWKGGRPSRSKLILYGHAQSTPDGTPSAHRFQTFGKAWVQTAAPVTPSGPCPRPSTCLS